MTDVKKFRNWCRWLRRNARVPYPVRIYRRQPSSNDNGLATWQYDSNGNPIEGIIEIAPNLSSDHTADILIHEWAHLMRALIHIGDSASEDHIQAAIEREISNEWDKKRATRCLLNASEPA